MPKWVYPLAFAFVIFLIFQDGTAAGDTAGDFAGFIVDLLGAIGEFLTGLFEGAGEASNSANTPTQSPSPSPTTSILSGAEESVNTFTHTHDGQTHTHIITEDHTISGN